MDTLKPQTKGEAKAFLSARDEGIIKAYDEQQEKNIPLLAGDFQVSPQTVRNILTKNGIKPVSNAKRGRKARETRPSSKLHHKISAMLIGMKADYRLKTGREPTVTMAANDIGMSKRAYEEIVAGFRDIRLSELQAIATKANISLAELVTVHEPKDN